MSRMIVKRAVKCHSVNSQPKNRIDLNPTDSCGVGCIVAINGKQNSKVLASGLTALSNVTHRGAIGADGKTGDGCGILTDIPDQLVKRWLNEAGIVACDQLIGIGCAFLPSRVAQREQAMHLIEATVNSLGIKFLGSRNVPIVSEHLGDEAAQRKPEIVQFFVSAATEDPEELERSLFIARRYIELNPQFSELPGLHIASLSCQKVVYKAMVVSNLLADFYPDLRDPEFECRVCIYHQRFSTNTAPDWDRCQPFRLLAHNGEINTIRGNRNWMTAREPSFDHEYWNQHRAVINKLFNFKDSDSASLDNAVELLNLSGRTLAHTLSMLIPAAWENDPRIPADQKAYYQYHSCFCEPWDGPAAVVAFDGKHVVASLDRNGLRPLRFKTTKDDLLIVGSEVGADREPLENITHSGRLGPGQSLAVSLDENKLLLDHEIKQLLAAANPYSDWLKENRIGFSPVDSIQPPKNQTDPTVFFRQQIAAGLTKEEVDLGIEAMATNGVESTFSMGVDTPLAVLSQQPRHLADYFKQRFAQVTNPPIDPIRERLSMSLAAGLGPERNLLSETPRHCRVFSVDYPVFLPHEFEQLESKLPFEAIELDCTFPRISGRKGLRHAIDRLVAQACLAVESQKVVLILSDRNADEDNIAIPMLLAIGGVHHGMQKYSQRMKASIVADTSDVRDAHQLALLFGYGCTAVYPRIGYGTIDQLIQKKKIAELSHDDCYENYRNALCKGVLKIMSKMGISVLNSYQGAQIFESIGLGAEVIDKCFKNSFQNLGGIGFDEIAADCILRHEHAYDTAESDLKFFTPGILKPKRAGEHHVINGKVTKNIHRFVNNNLRADYQNFVDELSNDRPVSVRDLLHLKLSDTPLPLEAVEPAESICTRFTTAAMSLGAISPEAHEAIAIAMNMIGGKSNSGEGGEDPSRSKPNADGTHSGSKIKQVASGRFGVHPTYLASAQEIEIKMAQGAKPGEGGQLPGFKVNGLIAKLRNTSPGVTLISPPPHHDIYSIEDLAQLIFDLKQINPTARVCVKLVAKSGVGGIAVGVVKSFADVVLISGHEGGTGASPLTSIKHAGLPWEIGLAETHQSLVAANLRDRVVLRADGGIRTGLDIIKASILGAEEFNFGTMALIALGCVYVKKCHLNNCPVGIATQDPKYRAKFKGKPENLVNYLNAVAEECRPILAGLGMKTLDQIVGRVDLLEQPSFNDEKISTVDTSAVIGTAKPVAIATTKSKYDRPVSTHISFDDQIIAKLPDPIADFEFASEINNCDRNIGTKLSGELTRRYPDYPPLEKTIRLNLTGTAGQSLGAFLCPGISINITGEANDYVGKGMAGGKIAIRRPGRCDAAMVIAGNAILYGATGGKLFAAGSVAERFCVRNSGAIAVVQGCGDHGCEYMTRGTAIILGTVGNNFGAGMTGGSAIVWQDKQPLSNLINRDSVEIRTLDESRLTQVKQHLLEFVQLTDSVRASQILKDWANAARRFQLVTPIGQADSLPKTPAVPHKKLATHD